jgi:hypothetical protein
MPSTSKKQHNFMEAVANNPAFAKKAGVPQSVGKDFAEADKGKKFGSGGSQTRADRQVVNQPKTDHGAEALFKKGGVMKMKETMGPRTMSQDVEKGSNKKIAFGQSALQKRGLTKGKNLGDSGPTVPDQRGAMGMKKGGNTSRMNRLEELGRVDSEKAFTAKGKKNLSAEKKRIVGGLKKMAAGGLSSGHKSANGVATKGKTKGTQIVMAGNKGLKKGGMAKKYC